MPRRLPRWARRWNTSKPTWASTPLSSGRGASPAREAPPMTRRRVVVTGMGVITPIGMGKEPFWAGLMEARSGVGRISRFDASGFDTRIAAEVRDFDPAAFMEKKEVRRNDRFVQFAYAATRMALDDAHFTITAQNAGQVGVLIGSGIGGAETWENQHQILLERGPGRVSPFFIPMIIVNMAAGIVSILTGAKGPNIAVVTACATGGNAIGDAMRIIQRGEATAMLAGGTEAAITPLSVAGFCSMKAMSTRNDEPAKASRPFDAKRDGFVMGEGAGMVLLDELDDRPPVRCRRRGGADHVRPGAPAPGAAPNDQLRVSRPGVRSGLHPQRASLSGSRRCDVQCLRLWRAQRHPDRPQV